jgi:hypothetical protein
LKLFSKNFSEEIQASVVLKELAAFTATPFSFGIAKVDIFSLPPNKFQGSESTQTVF